MFSVNGLIVCWDCSEQCLNHRIRVHTLAENVTDTEKLLQAYKPEELTIIQFRSSHLTSLKMKTLRSKRKE
jgi:hypothetical protein